MSKRFILLSIFSALLIGGFALTNQSLWIDEAQSAAKAMQPSLNSWWTTMAQERGSDLQMPFYMFFLWIWAKIFGFSEIALRAANLPWFAAGILALLYGVRQDRKLQLSVALIALSNAFLWYYISEARPYVVLFAFSSLTAACLLRLREDPNVSDSGTWLQLFMAGIIGLCATNMIAVPFGIGALLAFVFLVGARVASRCAARNFWSSVLAALMLVALAGYYLWSLQAGARATEIARTGVANLGFIVYELVGLAGLGPGRLVLREQGWDALSGYAPALIAGAVAVSIMFYAGVRRSKQSPRDLVFLGLAVFLPVLLLLAVALVTHVRLLGRHFTPLLPFLLVLLGLGLQQLLFAREIGRRAAAIAMLLVLFLSAIQIRFAARHQRDDYRSAAKTALDATGGGKKVWWAADQIAGAYYHLPQNSPDLVFVRGLNESDLRSAPQPDLVCYSKPDIFDPAGRIENYLRENHFTVTRTLPAFRIYQRSSDFQ